MNTIELILVINGISKDAFFLGVFACDQLPKSVQELPAMVVVNTDPSHLGGAHWLTMYITKHREVFFFLLETNHGSLIFLIAYPLFLSLTAEKCFILQGKCKTNLQPLVANTVFFHLIFKKVCPTTEY